ncbi:uncharacterized protein PG998_011459 [Apiospora kogelbergensis]|uniref:uncharacterized protein n=1 Tax=Apiospora kogelbergensis TaxID=1337665 RepID=UPI00312E4F8B
MPIPDFVYGYRGRSPTKHFTEAQLLAGGQIDPEMGRVDSRSLGFPFLIVKYKADGGFSVGENQCMGASATCVSMINKLNDKLWEYDDTQTVSNAVFIFLIDQYRAILYVSWMGPDGKYYMLPIEDFGFSAGPKGLRDLTSRVQNIFHWAARSRLKEIQRALDTIGEEGRMDSSIDRSEAQQAGCWRQPDQTNLDPSIS